MKNMLRINIYLLFYAKSFFQKMLKDFSILSLNFLFLKPSLPLPANSQCQCASSLAILQRSVIIDSISIGTLLISVLLSWVMPLFLPFLLLSILLMDSSQLQLISFLLTLLNLVSILITDSLKVFSRACFPLLRPYNPHKFDFRSHECVFLGYYTSLKAYKCLSPCTSLYI